ncbi:MAG: VCBS repeat-containing protein [Byssovorax sp.]
MIRSLGGKVGWARWLVGPAMIAAGCAVGGDPNTFTGTTGTGGASSTTATSTASGGPGGDFTSGAGGGTGGAPPPPSCKVVENANQNGVPVCIDKAPPNSFEPAVAWTWTAPPVDPGLVMLKGSFTTPLVGNFTDDNGDGAIDLCDTPDVLVVSIASIGLVGFSPAISRMFLLAGDTGALEVTFAEKVDGYVYPAFGDIDGDGLPEVVTADTDGRLVAFEHDGTVKWKGDPGGYRSVNSSSTCSTVAIYDLDGDGKPEIMLGFEVFDNQGHRLFGDPTNASEFLGQFLCVTGTAADLDGDGKLEAIFGHEAYHHDGSLYWKLDGFTPGHPHVANLDDDPEPEIFFTNKDGITILEHDGTVKFGPLRPTEPDPAVKCWDKPGVVHDFDGDGKAEIGAGTCSDFTVYEVGPSGLTPKWSQAVFDKSGIATATGFDFLGDGVAEAIYADEKQVYVFDGLTGAPSMTQKRISATAIEYPVVADVDNDGSAEILYVSNYQDEQGDGPALTVLRDAGKRWIPARRIWNQYSYHVTNVREDGTIPAKMKKSWQLLNTFRTNAQISTIGDCDPMLPPK